MLFCLSSCLFLVTQWRMSSCKIHALGHSCSRMTSGERGTTNSECPQGLTSRSASQSHISGPQQWETHPGRIWGAPENQKKCSLLIWRGQARTHLSYLLMGGSVEILTGAVPGDDLQGDRVESFSTISKSCNTDTFIPKKKKKVLFLAHLFHFGNWEQQNLWSPCKCLLAPHPCEQWTFFWEWFINAGQQQWLKLFF